MIDYSTGRPSQYMSAQDVAEASAEPLRHGIFTSMILPTMLELRAQAQLGGGDSWFNKIVGKSIYGNGNPADFQALDKAEKATLQAGSVIRPGPDIEVNKRQAVAARRALLLDSGARIFAGAALIDMGASIVGGAGRAIWNYRRAPRDIILKTSSGEFNDTRAAATQRQRSIQAIHNSQLTSRAALGNEASFLHI